MLKGHQHLVVYFRQEIETALGTGHGHGNTCPVAFVPVRKPGELDFHSPQALRILVVGDPSDHHAIDAVCLFVGS